MPATLARRDVIDRSNDAARCLALTACKLRLRGESIRPVVDHLLEWPDPTLAAGVADALEGLGAVVEVRP